MSVTRKGNGARKLAEAIDKLRSVRVMVGIPAEDAERTETDGSTSPINNAAIGYIQEKGSPAKNIPARPFLVPGVKDAQDEAVDHLKNGAAQAIHGNDAGLDKELNAAGLIAQSAVKKKMSSNVPPKLADSTLAARRRRGVTRTDTLVDTGNLQNHVTYVILRKKK